MNGIALLSGVLSKTGDLIEGAEGAEGAEAGRRGSPTPCEEYDVGALVDHLVGWLLLFEARCDGRAYEADPARHRCGPDPAGEFRAASAGLVAGWEKYGFDREIALTGESGLPAAMVFDMALMEFTVHGWDLAMATGRPVPFTEREAAEVLARAEATLPPQYRGEGMAFGPIVPVAEDAPAVDRLAGFLGRDPAWRA